MMTLYPVFRNLEVFDRIKLSDFACQKPLITVFPSFQEFDLPQCSVRFTTAVKFEAAADLSTTRDMMYQLAQKELQDTDHKVVYQASFLKVFLTRFNQVATSNVPGFESTFKQLGDIMVKMLKV